MPSLDATAGGALSGADDPVRPVLSWSEGVRYWTDYRDNLIPGWRFDDSEWTQAGLSEDEVPHVKLFLLLYWIMTGFHGPARDHRHRCDGRPAHPGPARYVHARLLLPDRRGRSLTGTLSDIVWISCCPCSYLLGTHTLFGNYTSCKGGGHGQADDFHRHLRHCLAGPAVTDDPHGQHFFLSYRRHRPHCRWFADRSLQGDALSSCSSCT